MSGLAGRMRRPKKRTVLILAAAVLVALCTIAVIRSFIPARVGPISDREYAVWDAVLEASWGSGQCVVDPLTVPEKDGCFGGQVGPVAAVGGYLSAPEPDRLTERMVRMIRPTRLSDSIREALADLRAKSRKVWPVRGEFTSRPNVKMLSPQERREIFEWRHHPWREFYRKFANGNDLGATRVQLSRVGLSRDGKVALVYRHEQCGDRNRSSHFDLVLLADSGWRYWWALDTWLGEEQRPAVSLHK